MTPEWMRLLEGMDAALTAALAATLTGMSLTAASLLANLVKLQSDKVKSFLEEKETYGRRRTVATRPASIQSLTQLEDAAAQEYQNRLGPPTT